MLGRTYDGEICSAARALEIVGERWSLLILRNAAFAGMTRFTEFQRSLQIAPNVLSARLAHFVATGLMVTSDEPEGHQAYRLTERGLHLKPVIVALSEWGDRWAAPDGAPIAYEHEGCGGRVRAELRCTRCGKRPRAAHVSARKTAVGEALLQRRAPRRARRA